VKLEIVHHKDRHRGKRMLRLGASYFNECRRPKYVARDMEEIARIGASYVVHQFAEIDWEQYCGTMRRIVAASHEAGLDVWLSQAAMGYVFGSDEYSKFCLLHPDARQCDQHGVRLMSACPNQPVFRSFVRRWIDAAVDLGTDMLFFDEPHLFIGSWEGQPERWGCRCPLCRSMYREQFGSEMPTDREEPSIKAFRSWTLLHFLGELIAYATAQGARSSVTLLPESMSADTSFLEWDSVAALPGLANLGSDPYPFDESRQIVPWVGSSWQSFVSASAGRIADVCRKNHLDNHLWIQGFNVPADDHGYIEGAPRLAVASGITSIAINGFIGNGDMTSESCEQPEAVWERVRRTFQHLRESVPPGRMP
jgi:hypothetical protein